MKILDSVLAWLLIAFGALHLAMTHRVHPDIDINAVWFVAGGLMIMLVGVLNLLRGTYSSVAKGVRLVSLLANLALLSLTLWIASLLPLRANPQVVVALVLAGLLTAFSILRRDNRVSL